MCWNKKNKRWQAAINSSGKYLYLGSYDTEEEASKIFDKAAVRIRGQKARLNFRYRDYVDAVGTILADSMVETLLLEACNPTKPRRQRARTKQMMAEEALQGSPADSTTYAGLAADGSTVEYPDKVSADIALQALARLCAGQAENSEKASVMPQAVHEAVAGIMSTATTVMGVASANLDKTIPKPKRLPKAGGGPTSQQASLPQSHMAPSVSHPPSAALPAPTQPVVLSSQQVTHQIQQLQQQAHALQLQHQLHKHAQHLQQARVHQLASGLQVPSSVQLQQALQVHLQQQQQQQQHNQQQQQFLQYTQQQQQQQQHKDSAANIGLASLVHQFQQQQHALQTGATTSSHLHHQLQWGSQPSATERPPAKAAEVSEHDGAAAGATLPSTGNVFSQISRSLPQGATLDSIIPSDADGVLGVLYRSGDKSGAGVWTVGRGFRNLGKYGCDQDAKQACQGVLETYRDFEPAATSPGTSNGTPKAGALLSGVQQPAANNMSHLYAQQPGAAGHQGAGNKGAKQAGSSAKAAADAATAAAAAAAAKQVPYQILLPQGMSGQALGMDNIIAVIPQAQENEGVSLESLGYKIEPLYLNPWQLKMSQPDVPAGCTHASEVTDESGNEKRKRDDAEGPGQDKRARPTVTVEFAALQQLANMDVQEALQLFFTSQGAASALGGAC